MPSTYERVGTYTLELAYDDQGRLTSANAGPWRLVVEPDVPRARMRGLDGSETWERGKTNGTWVDLPYGHENDVSAEVPFEAWLAEQLRLMRGMVFACGKEGKVPTGALAVEAVEYALANDVLTPRVFSLPARDTFKKARNLATPEQFAAWRATLTARGLVAYLEVLDAATNR